MSDITPALIIYSGALVIFQCWLVFLTVKQCDLTHQYLNEARRLFDETDKLLEELKRFK